MRGTGPTSRRETPGSAKAVPCPVPALTVGSVTRPTRRNAPALLALSAALAACSASHPVAVRHVAAPAPLVSATPPRTHPAKPVHRAPVDPLTGLAMRHSPIVVVKVDNATTARSYQRGLDHAAIVYQELVESGQTRFAAVYDNAYAGEVGPIRSVRETDLELLPELGRVAVAFSGGNSGIKGQFRSAVRAGKLLDASYDVLPHHYRLGEQRVDARNFYATPGVLAAISNGATPHRMGLVFGPLPAGAGKPASTAEMRFSEIASVGVRYHPDSGRYAVSQDGTAMPGVAAANVIVQSVPIRRGRYVDVLGAPSPVSDSIGHGRALILRDGRAIHATWKRTSARTGTRYVDDKGRDIPLHAGSTWVLLLPDSRSATIG